MFVKVFLFLKSKCLNQPDCLTDIPILLTTRSSHLFYILKKRFIVPSEKG